MKFTIDQQKIAQIALLVIGLIPAFVHGLDAEQRAAIALFVGSCQAMLGVQAHNLTPDGRKVNDVLAEVPAKEVDNSK